MSGGGSGDEPVKIVVVKKKASHDHGHHGGSWKVAYADFVTAMMAFFLVMWIMGMDPEVKDSVQGYFSDPVGFENGRSAGANMISVGEATAAVELNPRTRLTLASQQRRFEAAARAMREELGASGLLEGLEAEISIEVTEEGLRVELMETGSGETFFDKASWDLKPAMDRVLRVLGAELEAVGNPVVVEGHTDALPFVRPGFTNWELSVQRANAARKVLVSGGLQPSRVHEVRGHSDRQPKNEDDPLDPRNRRISILLPFADEVVDDLPRGAAVAAAGPAGGGSAAPGASPPPASIRAEPAAATVEGTVPSAPGTAPSDAAGEGSSPGDGSR